MMLKREYTHRDGLRPSALTRGVRLGSAAFVLSASTILMWTGSSSAALARVDTVVQTSGNTACHDLPAPPSPPPTPSPSPSPSTSSSASATPTTSSSSIGTAGTNGNAPITQLCVTVQGTADSVEVGHDAQFEVTVWPLGGTADGITVQSSTAPSSLPGATFTTCGSGDGTATCTVGDLNANQQTQLLAQIAVPSDASTSVAATLAADVTGTAVGASSSGSVSAAAQTDLTSPPTTPPHHGGSGSSGSGHSSTSHSGSGGSGSGTSTDNLGDGLGSGSGGDTTGDTTPQTEPTLSNPSGTGSVGNPSGLFPTINPSGSSSGGSHGARTLSGPYKPSTVADVLPLNTSQVGSQVAGLVVLAIGIVIAIARVSLRKPKPTTPGED
jgi:hypothetical protein